jgi:hypothetical protein
MRLLISFVGALAALVSTGVSAGEQLTRRTPEPSAAHPGNIFLADEEVTVPLPEATTLRLIDYDGRLVRELGAAGSTARLGQLATGYYRVAIGGSSNSISLGVLNRLQSPTPLDSPIGLDVAMAWFYGEKRMPAVANLCALAGVNWVRDRLTWPDMEPAKGQFSSSNRYDASALAQTRSGLRVLQVIHLSPPWANPNTKRFPLDLRDSYRFYEAMARRWRGQVQAFEPWNEADIPMFGGHTGSEMASLQKAAYLGLKAGNPDIVACLNVFAMHNPAQLQDLNANEPWPYFDTFNLHHYAPFDEYPKLYADFRAVSAGRPLWVTECSLPVKWTGSDSLKEPTDADLKVQSERVAKTFACSLHEGSDATFYFMLPHYVEGQTQFGILRPDLTPRPAYIALAAVGRLLAQAQPLGRLHTEDNSVRAFLFHALPDGKPEEVLVAWTTHTNASIVLPVAPLQVLDHLGRPTLARKEVRLSQAPVFVRLPIGSGKELSLISPPGKPPRLNGKPCPLVLQALWPADKLDLKLSAYRIGAHQAQTIPVYAYNFGSEPVRGTLRVQSPAEWQVTLPTVAEIPPMGRLELPLNVSPLPAASGAPAEIRIVGQFGPDSQELLSLRLVF